MLEWGGRWARRGRDQPDQPALKVAHEVARRVDLPFDGPFHEPFAAESVHLVKRLAMLVLLVPNIRRAGLLMVLPPLQGEVTTRMRLAADAEGLIR